MQSRSEEATENSNNGNEHYSEERPSKRRRGHGLDGLLSRESGLMRDGVGSSSATFVGSASGIYFIRSVYGVIGSPAAANTSPEANLVPGEDDQLAIAAKPIWHETEVVDSAQLSFDILVGMTESYFDLWHPAFPFLHAPRVLDVLESIAKGNVAHVAQWDLVIIRSIVSIALADRRQRGPSSQPVPRNLLFQTFDEAVQSLTNAMTRPATLTALQAVISVQLFLVSMLRLNVACRLGGLIVQMAYQLGLHRCPARYSSFTSEERQLRKRIWWSAYILERYTCQALGLPLLIHDDDVDVCAFNIENHNAGNLLASPIDARMRLLDLLAKHARLRGLIVELRNKSLPERDRNPDTALRISAQLARWWNEVEDTIDDNERSISAFHRTVLETLKHESALMLNRPLLALPKNTASFASAIEICISAAKALLSNLGLLQSDGATSSLVWPSFTWAAWMSAFVILFAVAEEKVSTIAATKNVDKSLTILASLAVRESVWPRACAVAIEDLRKAWVQRVSASASRASRLATPRDHGANQSANEATPSRRQQSPLPPATLWQQQRQPSQQINVSKYTNTGASDLVNSLQFPHRALDGESLPNLGDEPNQVTDFDWLNGGLFRGDSQPMLDNTDPLQSFDIPFWLGADNTLAWMGENT